MSAILEQVTEALKVNGDEAVHAPEPTGETCGRCAWWVRWSHPPHSGEVLGECRKRSPKTYMRTGPNGTESPITKWPSTRTADFCGEWKPRKEMLP